MTNRMTPGREADIRCTLQGDYCNPLAVEILAELDAVRTDRAAEKANMRDALRAIRRGCTNPNCDCSAAIANRIIDGILLNGG